MLLRFQVGICVYGFVEREDLVNDGLRFLRVSSNETVHISESKKRKFDVKLLALVNRSYLLSHRTY